MNSLLKLILAVLIGGTAGIAVAHVPLKLPLLVTAQFLVATLALSLMLVLRKSNINKGSVRSHAVSLLISGALLGVGAALAVEAVRTVGESSASMVMFIMPVLAFAVAPFILKERFVSARLLCLLTSLTGAVLLSGFVLGDRMNVAGVMLSLLSAVCFAAMLIMQKKLSRVPSQELLFYHFLIASVIMIVYLMFNGFAFDAVMSGEALLWLLALGAIHAAAVGCLFVGALSKLSVQKVALFCYVVPAATVLFRSLFFDTALSTWQIIGIILIGASTTIGECIAKK